jgi:two-component sensor histidine kinase
MQPTPDGNEADLRLPEHTTRYRNALKHAFPGGRSGSVRVILSKQSSGELALTVEDDGIGLPAQYASGTGHIVLTHLAEQLDGRLESKSSKIGASFCVTFPYQMPGAADVSVRKDATIH